ncbi:YugE family protein [Bacillus timonensis]|nr:YugE family protein [Bacillus timonensis]
MEMRDMNLKLMDLLLGWDPLGYGQDAYETEVVDVLQAVHEYDDVSILSRRIQSIYEFSFEEVIPLKVCKKMAEDLLAIKNEGTCEI